MDLRAERETEKENEQNVQRASLCCVACDSLCDLVLMCVIAVVYLLESVPLYLALSEFLQQHQLGLL